MHMIYMDASGVVDSNLMMWNSGRRSILIFVGEFHLVIFLDHAYKQVDILSPEAIRQAKSDTQLLLTPILLTSDRDPVSLRVQG